MNIWLPIVVNAIIFSILLGGLLIGKKKGFLYEFLKLVFVAGVGVGLYFLNPTLVSLALKVPFIQTLVDGGTITLSILKSLTLVLAFVLADVILTGIFAIVRKIAYGKNHVKANTAKSVKIKGITKAETRSLRKEHKHLVREQKREERKLAKAQIKKRTKILGAIFGLLNAIIVAFVLTLPLKPAFKDVAEHVPQLTEIEKGYEYTPFGQLDKVTDIVNKVLGE